ncbi:vWA domain-containing protein [Defluviitalea saccharophila]|uniref:VWA domain-containing protein n=1 Tax=Defluviitalea saccharophila TaxID=879970 RepID=A0ABZ2Y1D4_9FIRM
MRSKKKIGFYLTLAFILQLVLTPFQALGATGYTATITRVERESVLTVGVGSTVEVTHTLYGKSETYEPSLREIALVLDVSGSMADSMGGKTKLAALKDTAKQLVEEYKGEKVRISLIQYSNSADNPTKFYDMKINSDVTELKNKISSMSANGATNIGDGMRRGYYQLLNSGNENANKYMIVMTDGVPQGFTLNSITDTLDNYKINDGNTGVTQSSGYDTYTRKNTKENFYRFKGSNNITILGETTGETQREYSAAYAKKIGNMIVQNGKIQPFFIGFSSNTNFGYLNEIAKSSKAELVGNSRYYYDAKSATELENAFKKIQEKMSDKYQFQYVKYEEMIPKDVEITSVKINGIEYINDPSVFDFKSQGGGNERKFTIQLKAAMEKNPETGKYDFVCEPFTISYKFSKPGEYVFDKASLDYKDPFSPPDFQNSNNGMKHAPVDKMTITVTGEITLKPLYLKKGTSDTLTAGVNLKNYELTWSILEGSDIILLEKQNASTAKVTGIEVGRAKVKVKDEKSGLEAETYIYVYNYEGSNLQMIVGQTKNISVDIPADMIMRLEEPLPESSKIKFDESTGEVWAKAVGRETIKVLLGYNEITEEGPVFVTQASLNKTIDVFNVEFKDNAPTGYLYPDKATYRLNFIVSAPDENPSLPAGKLKLTPNFDGLNIGLTPVENERIKEVVIIPKTVSRTVNINGYHFDPSTNTLVSNLSELPAGEYEVIITLGLKPASSLTISAYKGYVNSKKASSNNVFEVLEETIPLGTDANGKIEIPIKNSPIIK